MMQKLAEAIPEQDEFELRKQAILVGLSQYLSLKQSLEAIRLWEQQYSRAPKFALQQFIKQVVTTDSQLWELRNDIFINVIKVMSMPAQEIEQQYQQIFHEGMDIAGPTKESSNWLQQQVFENLYQTFIRQLESQDLETAGKLRKFLREKMLQGRAFAMERQRVNSWLLGITDQLEIEMSLREMKQIVHYAYLGSCEYLGPVKADALLAEAIKKVEKTFAGSKFSVRKLL